MPAIRFASLLALAACHKDETIPEGKDDSGQDSGVPDTSCEGDDECADWEICEGGECVDGDRNESPEQAETLLWDAEVQGWINPDGDVDYYAFTAEGGETVRVATTTEYEDADTVVALRKTNGKVVAWADEFATETSVTGVDSVVFAYLAEAGEYFVSVEDVGTWYDGGEPAGSPDYAYALTLEEWNRIAEEKDSFEAPAYTVDLDEDRLWSSVGVLLETEGDVDYVEIVHGADGANLFLDGNQDMDGSDAVTRVRLFDAAGTLLSDKSSVGPDHYALYPVAPAGTYVAEVSDAGGGGGSNAWLFLHVISRFDDPAFDEEAEPNGESSMATALSMAEYENSNGDAYSRGQGLGWIDSAADADWFEFQSDYEEGWVVACVGSSTWGSAVAPTLEIYDDGGDVLASGEGSASAYPNASVENVEVAPGTYHVRIVPPGDAAGGSDAWYRFYVYVATFSVASYEEGGYACP